MRVPETRIHEGPLQYGAEERLLLTQHECRPEVPDVLWDAEELAFDLNLVLDLVIDDQNRTRLRTLGWGSRLRQRMLLVVGQINGAFDVSVGGCAQVMLEQERLFDLRFRDELLVATDEDRAGNFPTVIRLLERL